MNTQIENTVKKRVQYGDLTHTEKDRMRTLDFGEENGIEASFRKERSARTMMGQVNAEGNIILTSVMLEDCVLIYRPKEQVTA